MRSYWFASSTLFSAIFQVALATRTKRTVWLRQPPPSPACRVLVATVKLAGISGFQLCRRLDESQYSSVQSVARLVRKVCWLASVGRGETGGERPQKRDSKFDPFRTTEGVRRKPEYADHSRSFDSEAEAEAGAVALRCLPRLTKPGCERYSDLSPTSDSCMTRPPKLSPLKGATMLKK